MKNPKDASDPLNRHNAAGEQTVIIGDASNAGGAGSSNAPTSLVSGSAAASREPPGQPNLPKTIPSDPGHTLRPVASPCRVTAAPCGPRP